MTSELKKHLKKKYPATPTEKLIESKDKLLIENSELRDKLDLQDELLHRIKQWCQAYPIDVFQEPDFKKAARVLKDNGMTLDSISASSMRYVVTQIAKIIEEAQS